jgi:hypothetical protein
VIRGPNPSIGENSHTRPNRPCGPHILLYNGYRVPFPGGSGLGLALTIDPHLAPMLKKDQSYNSTVPMGFNGLFLMSVTFKFSASYVKSWRMRNGKVLKKGSLERVRNKRTSSSSPISPHSSDIKVSHKYCWHYKLPPAHFPHASRTARGPQLGNYSVGT